LLKLTKYSAATKSNFRKQITFIKQGGIMELFTKNIVISSAVLIFSAGCTNLADSARNIGASNQQMVIDQPYDALNSAARYLSDATPTEFNTFFTNVEDKLSGFALNDTRIDVSRTLTADKKPAILVSILNKTPVYFEPGHYDISSSRNYRDNAVAIGFIMKFLKQAKDYNHFKKSDLKYAITAYGSADGIAVSKSGVLYNSPLAKEIDVLPKSTTTYNGEELTDDLVLKNLSYLNNSGLAAARAFSVATFCLATLGDSSDTFVSYRLFTSDEVGYEHRYAAVEISIN